MQAAEVSAEDGNSGRNEVDNCLNPYFSQNISRSEIVHWMDNIRRTKLAEQKIGRKMNYVETERLSGRMRFDQPN